MLAEGLQSSAASRFGDEYGCREFLQFAESTIARHRANDFWPGGGPPAAEALPNCGWVCVEDRPHHQPEAMVLDFVNPEFSATLFFSALRFLVAVLSDLSGCSCVLKALFSKVSRRP